MSGIALATGSLMRRTGAELFESYASWSLQFLATTLHATGWLIIAAIVVAAAAGIRPSARMAQHYLAEGLSAPKPVLAAAE